MLTQNQIPDIVDYFVNRVKNFKNWKINKQSNRMHPIVQRWEYMNKQDLSLFYAKMILIDSFNLLGPCFNPDDSVSEYIDLKDKRQSLQDREIEILQSLVNSCIKTFEDNEENIHDFCIDVVKYNY